MEMIRRHGRGGRFFRPDLVQGTEETVAFHPKEPCADQHDERVAHDFDDAHRLAHHPRRSANQDRCDGDDGHGRERLQQGRRERQHDAASPGLLIGEQVG
jgi:hypothetical protein